MAALAGYKTVIAFSLAFACALWQYFVGPLPAVDAQQFGLAVTIVGLALRFVTKSPVGQKPTQ